MLRIRDIMTQDVMRLSSQNTILEAMEMLSSNHVSGAPVLAGDIVVGVVSMTDLIGFIVSGPAEQNLDSGDMGDGSIELDGDSDIESVMSGEIWDAWSDVSDGQVDKANPTVSRLLEQSTVEEIMNTEIFSLTPDASVRQAAEVMRKKGIHRVLVMQGRSLVGIISAFDVARAVSRKGTADDAPITFHIPHAKRSAWLTDNMT
jgi:CBS domain-containing protein